MKGSLSVEITLIGYFLKWCIVGSSDPSIQAIIILTTQQTPCSALYGEWLWTSSYRSQKLHAGRGGRGLHRSKKPHSELSWTEAVTLTSGSKLKFTHTLLLIPLPPYTHTQKHTPTRTHTHKEGTRLRTPIKRGVTKATNHKLSVKLTISSSISVNAHGNLTLFLSDKWELGRCEVCEDSLVRGLF